jgi:hypothetical protein
MKNLLQYAFALFLIIITIPGKSQTYDPSKIIPPTPNADALGSFGNVAVGYNSGVPDISVPLYQIKTKSNILNIALKYNASGIKAAQQSTWVGLGWSLMAGGVISRNIRGRDDFKDNLSYYNGGTLPPLPPFSNPVSPIANKAEFDEMYFGRVDGEPDLFNYNFGQFSGSFVLGKKVDGSIVYVDEQNNLKVEYNGSWIVTDDKGYKYYFQTGEAAINHTYSSNTAQVLPTSSLAPFTFESITNTAWYLDKIVAPDGDTINFTYTRGQSLSLINMSETQFDRVSNFIGCPTGESFLAYYKNFNASRQLNSDVYLKSISFANGTLEFTTTPRKDIDFVDQTQVPAKLSFIDLFDKNHSLVKRYTLGHSYFKDPGGTSTATEFLRLKLDNVTETGQNGITKPPYKFFYYSDGNLPSKYTKGIDHWGFSNGAANSRLLPMPSSLRPQTYFATDDANREPSTDDSYVQAATLNSIQYPTGGHTDFEFELNDYAVDSFIDQGVSYLVNASPWDHFDHTSVSFDIHLEDLNPAANDPTTGGCPGVVYSSYSYVENTPILSGVQTDYASLNGPTASVTLRNDPSKDPLGTGQFISTVPVPVSLGVGHYTLRARYIQGYSVSASVYFTKRVKITERKGGGLRVKTITNVDNANVLTMKKYSYTDDGKSSGVLTTMPVYGYNCPGIYIENTCYPSGSYICRMSGSAFPEGLGHKGGIVGYNKVTESIGVNGEGGRTEYYYLNSGQIMSGYPGQPALAYPGVPLRDNPMNGKLKKVITYKASGEKLKEVVNDYSVKLTTTLPGVQIYLGPPLPIPPSSSQGPQSSPMPYNVYFYNSESKWIVMDSTTETNFVYNNGGVLPVTTTNSYYYDNPAHLQLTRQMTSKSDGKAMTSVINYADDYPVGTGFIDDMKTAHITGVPIEEVTYLGSGNTAPVISGQVTKFKTGGKGLVDQVLKLESLPIKTLATFKFSNSLLGQLPSPTQSAYLPDSKYQPQITVNLYDDAGNTVWVTPENGSPIVFIWSYNKQYPVAKILNGNYAAIITALGGVTTVNNFANSSPTDVALNTFLNPLRSNPAMSNAQMTTYTYNPLIGMTSMTDAKGLTTYYEYDSFQRLVNVKDKDGNIIKHTDYHYQGQ